MKNKKYNIYQIVNQDFIFVYNNINQDINTLYIIYNHLNNIKKNIKKLKLKNKDII